METSKIPVYKLELSDEDQDFSISMVKKEDLPKGWPGFITMKDKVNLYDELKDIQIDDLDLSKNGNDQSTK